MSSSLQVLLLSALLGSCGAAPAVTTTTITDGTLECLEGNRVKVRFDGCLSSSCDTLLSAECTLTVHDDTASVVGQAVVQSEGNTCTGDCGLVFATCTGDVGAAVEVEFGDERLDLTDLPACD